MNSIAIVNGGGEGCGSRKPSSTGSRGGLVRRQKESGLGGLREPE